MCVSRGVDLDLHLLHWSGTTGSTWPGVSARQDNRCGWSVSVAGQGHRQWWWSVVRWRGIEDLLGRQIQRSGGRWSVRGGWLVGGLEEWCGMWRGQQLRWWWWTVLKLRWSVLWSRAVLDLQWRRWTVLCWWWTILRRRLRWWWTILWGRLRGWTVLWCRLRWWWTVLLCRLVLDVRGSIEGLGHSEVGLDLLVQRATATTASSAASQEVQLGWAVFDGRRTVLPEGNLLRHAVFPVGHVLLLWRWAVLGGWAWRRTVCVESCLAALHILAVQHRLGGAEAAGGQQSQAEQHLRAKVAVNVGQSFVKIASGGKIASPERLDRKLISSREPSHKKLNSENQVYKTRKKKMVHRKRTNCN